MFKRQGVKDERIELWQNKIGNEAFVLVMGLLFVKFLYRQLAYGLQPGELVTELGILLVGALYTVIRSVLTGTFTYNTNRKRRVTGYLFASLFAGVLTGGLVGLRNFFLYDFAPWQILLVAIPMVFFITPPLFVLVMFIENLARKRADVLAESDDEDE